MPGSRGDLVRRTILQPLGDLILHSALHLLATETRSQIHTVRHALAAGDGAMHARLRLLIARQMRLAMRMDVPVLVDLHVFGSTLNDEVRPLSDLDLLVHLRKQDPVVEKDLVRLGKEVSAAYRNLMGDRVPAGFDLVSLHVVTDDDVRTRQGFGALVGSLHEPSLRVET